MGYLFHLTGPQLVALAEINNCPKLSCDSDDKLGVEGGGGMKEMIDPSRVTFVKVGNDVIVVENGAVVETLYLECDGDDDDSTLEDPNEGNEDPFSSCDCGVGEMMEDVLNNRFLSQRWTRI